MEAERAAVQAEMLPLRPQESLLEFLLTGPTAPAALKTFCNMAEQVLGSETDRIRTSYAMDLVEAGALGKDAAIAVLCRCWSRKMPVPFSLHALTIARVLYPRMHEVCGKETTWGGWLVVAVMGLDAFPTRPPHHVGTEEGLAAAAAVVQFVLAFQGGGADGKITRIFEEGVDGARRGRAVVNPHLERLLRECPDEAGRITAYVRERGMHPTRRRDVDELRGWLDMEAPAIADGWL